MKRIFLGVYLCALLGAEQAAALEISGSSAMSFPRYDDQPLIAAENSGVCGPLTITPAGTTYRGSEGNENGYVDSSLSGFGYGTPWDWGNPETASQWAGASIAGFGSLDDESPGLAFKNADRQENPLHFAILNGQTALNGQTGRFGMFDYISGGSHGGDPDYDGSVVSANPASMAPVPRLQAYAMLLAGLGLLGISARRRKRDPFD